MKIASLQSEIHQNSINHGFWLQGSERPVPEVVALIHSELSEAWDAYLANESNRRLVGGSKAALEFFTDEFKEEIVDTAIRIMDACGGYGIDLETEILNVVQPIPHNTGETMVDLLGLHSSTSRILELYRKGENWREGLVFLAYSVFQFAAGVTIAFEDEIRKKMEKNQKRPSMHGKLC